MEAIKYTPRYSQTDEPDNMGRWARKCMFKDRHIAWISRLETEKGVKFILSPYFPITSQDFPSTPKICDTFNEAQEKLEELWKSFISIIK